MQPINIQQIPSQAGIYLFKDKKGTILYIGKAKNLQKRIGQYFSPNSLRKQEMIQKADTIDFLIVKNESEALYLEDNMIKQHQPFYNNLLKADNSYIYIKITKEQFPQIFLTRKKINDGALYIGPKNDTIQLKKFLQYLRQILKFRGCKSTQFRQGKLCSDYYFGLCKGRCTGEKKSLQQYQELIKIITSFFKGNTKPIEKEIHKQIQEAIHHQHFEWAAQLRDIYQSIQGFVEKQNVVLEKPIDGYISLIKTIGTQYIYTVLVFVQGKLIDVITSKEQIDDIEKDSLELSIQRTFGEGTIHHTTNETIIIGNQQKSSEIFSFNHLKSVLHLAENFLESYIITQSFQSENVLINDMLKQLQTRYNLKHFPYRIECIDISHLSGGRTSGGLSCILEGLPYKKGYRRYKIKAKKSDDYEALQELLERKFSTSLKERGSGGEDYPNLLIIDGGKGQLGVVKKLYKDPKRKKIISQIDIVSLGKGEARTKSNIGKTKKTLDKGGNEEEFVNKITEIIYYFNSKLSIKSQAMVYDQADKILLKARDEAHRFANSYRKKQMSQEIKSK